MLGYYLTARKWTKMLDRFAVDVEDLEPEAREQAEQALTRHYMTSVFP